MGHREHPPRMGLSVSGAGVRAGQREGRKGSSLSPPKRVDHDGVGLINHARDQRLAILAFHLRHLNDISPRVCPVDVPSNPVDGNSPRHLQPRDL